MATFNRDDRFYLKNQRTNEAVVPGIFTAVPAKARAVALSIETGDSIEVFVVGSKAAERGESVAVAIAGQFMMYQPHDENGNSLPFEPWPGDEDEL